MYRIKIVSVLIVVFSILLALLFHTISEENSVKTDFSSKMNAQKSSIQEISKSILYLYKNKGSSTKELEGHIEHFLTNIGDQKEDSVQYEALMKLWNEFYVLVQQFQKEQKVFSVYSSILIDKLVNDIYVKNQKLIVAFDSFINTKERVYDELIDRNKSLEDILFAIVALLLIYLFIQMNEIISFIQKFTTTSKSILQKATIKGLKPIEIDHNDKDLKEATDNFNHLVEKIDKAIVYSQESITHTTTALEEVERKIEDLLTFISQMQGEESDTLSQKEDTVIDSLETLMNLTHTLKNLNKDLDQLTSSL